ncbi:MAG: DUF4129 domain-containing protein [Candidatus Promineifilaceae bacterium]
MSKLVRANQKRLDEGVDEAYLADLRRRYRSGRVVRHVVRPLLLAILVSALFTAILAVVVEVTGDRRWFALIPLLFFIALEAIFTTDWLSHPSQLAINRGTYRAAELLLLLVLILLSSWIVFVGRVPDLEQLEEFLRSPQTLFLNVPFLVTLVAAALVWRMAVNLSAIFSRLEISEYELRFQSLPPGLRKERSDDKPIQTDRNELVHSFTSFWLVGGIVMVIAVGLSTLGQQSVETLFAPLVSARAHLNPLLLSALLLYFIIGLWLLSQANLMHRNARWLVNGLKVDAKARRGWQRASLIMILLVAFVAALLPIGSTSTLSQIVSVLLYWLLFLANAIIFLITLPFALILAFFTGAAAAPLEQLPGTLQPPPLEPLPESGPTALADTIAMVLSSGFWAVFVVAVVLAGLYFLRERRSGAGATDGAHWRKKLRAWLAALWLRLRGGVLSLQSGLGSFRESEPSAPKETAQRPHWRFLRVGGLPPREQLRYFYLSTLRRAGDKGVERPSAGTPVEFLDTLQQNWPEAGENLDELTEAFLKARYSDEPVDVSDLPPVKATWKAARRKLRQDPQQRLEQENGDNQTDITAGEE